MSKNFKLLKDLSDESAGRVESENYWREHHLLNAEDLPDWFEEVKEGFEVEKWHINESNNWKEASIEEVKKKLIEEAENRFPKGIVFRSVRSGTSFKSLGMFTVDSDLIVFNGYVGVIFEKGKWAEVVEQPKEKTFTLGEEEVTVKDGKVSLVRDPAEHIYFSVWLMWYTVNFKTASGRMSLFQTEITNSTIRIGCIENITYEQVEEVAEEIIRIIDAKDA